MKIQNSKFKIQNYLKLLLISIFGFTILALNTNEVHAQTPPILSDYVWNPPPLVATSSAALDLRQKLTNEIEKMIQDKNGNGKYDDHVAPFAMVRGLTTTKEFYFVNPAETTLALSTAYPYVPAATQAKIREYLSYELATFPPTQTDICPKWPNVSCFRDGVRREYAPLPADFPQDIYWKHAYGETELDGPSLENLYGLWAYGYYLGEWNYLQAHYTEIKNIYTSFKNWMASQSLTQPKYLTQIGGLIGFARIAQQFGDTVLASEAANYAILGLQAASGNGFATFKQNSETLLLTNYSTTWETNPFAPGYWTIPLFFYDFSQSFSNIFIPYMTLFPKELGLFLHDYSQTEVQDFLNKVEAFHPGWSLTEPANSFWTEDAYNPQHDKWTIFKLHAYVLGDSQEQLRKYLDVPISMGDLFYMQMLVAAIETPGGSTQPCTLTSSSWNPTSTTQGSTVALNVNTSGSCSNQQVNLTIFKNGLCGGQLNTTITPNPAPITNNLASASWTSEYTSDICGVLGSPNQYYFNATLGTQSITSSLLSVSPSITPTPTPTTVPTPTSTPGPISGNDWPQLQRDPQRTGYSPVQVNPNYSLKWKWNTVNNASIRSSMRTQPVAAGGKVFFGSYDGKMYAIDMNTSGGAEAQTLWSYQTGGTIFNSAAYDGGKVFFGSDDGYFYALNDNGTLAWKYQTGGSIWTAPLVVNNTVYFGSWDGYFYALNEADGALKWRYDTKAPILNSAAYSAKQNTVYFGSENMNAYGLDAATGALKWQKKLAGQSFRDSWPVVHEANDIVFFTTMPAYPHTNQLIAIGQQLSTTSLQTELANLRQFYTSNPDRVTFFALDSISGSDKFTQPVPVAYTSGSGGTFAAPVINSQGEVFVVTRTGFNNYFNGGTPPNIGCCAALGKLDLTTGDVSILPVAPVGTTTGGSFRLVGDESSWLSLSGNRLLVSMSQSVGQIEVVNGAHSHIIHEKEPTNDGAYYSTPLAIFGSTENPRYTSDLSSLNGGPWHVAVPYAPAIVAGNTIIWRADGGALAGVGGQ